MDRTLHYPSGEEARHMKLSLAARVAFAIVTMLPSAASAQEAPAPPAQVTTAETTSQATGPSMTMVGAGIGVFGLSYIPAVAVAASSGTHADKALYVPFAGPWIDLAQRPACTSASTCNPESRAKVMIAIDGVCQALGGLTIIGGFLTTTHETTTIPRTASLHPTLRLSPTQMGNGGYGLLALGTF